MRVAILLSTILHVLLGHEMAISQTPDWRLEATHVIGSFDDEQTAFEYVVQVFTGRDGAIFVVDSDAPRIAVFDSTGAFLHNIGREGPGPAEFRLMNSAGLTADTLWIFDGPQGKVVRFAPEGTFIRSERLDAPEGPAFPLAVSPDQVLGLGHASLATDSAYLVRSNGERVTTLAAVHRPLARIRIEIGTVNASLSHEFHDGELVAVSADGRVIYVIRRPIAHEIDSGAFHIIRFSAQGDQVWTRSYNYAPLAVSDDHIESVANEIVWRFTQLPMLRGRDAAVRRAVIAALPIPRFAPPVWSAVAADDGSLWLERAKGKDSSRWIVLNSDGEVAGRAVLPATVRLSSVRGNQACGVDHRGTDFPRVVCYRVRP